MNKRLHYFQFVRLTPTTMLMQISSMVIFSFLFSNALFSNAEPEELGCTMVCIGHVNLSLDSDCKSAVTYRSLLRDPDNYAICHPTGPSSFGVSIYDEQGNSFGNIVDESHIGKTLDVKVKHLYSDTYCWGKLTVEDKVGPWTACLPDITIACTESTDPSNTGIPEFTDCSDFSLDYYDEKITKSCPSEVSAIIKRTWIATDVFGNSKSCSHIIKILRSSIGDVVEPVNYDGTGYPDKPALSCNASTDPYDIPGPRAVPTLNGQPIVNGNSYCKLTVDYKDSDQIPICGNGYKLIRTWTIIDWCDGTIKKFTQLIKVDDKDAPMIFCEPFLHFGTSASLCTGTIQIPPAVVSDECSTVSVRINTPFGQIFSNGGILENVSLGTHEITYIATDECGNEAKCKSKLIVADDDPPIAICDKSTVITLSEESITKVNAKVFDSGSFDNCDDVDFVASRGGPFDQYVSFTCDDKDKDVIIVTLRVFEKNNPQSYSECHVEVSVHDRTPPKLISCPANLVVDCDDLSGDLSVYGAPSFSDNCGFEIVPSVIEDLDNCGIGKITRIWKASDDNGTVTCKQVITVENKTPFNGTIQFPPDITLYECGVEITEEMIGRPTLPTGIECSLLSVNYTDETYTSVADACFKIIRRWKVIDWCQYNPALDPWKGKWEHYQSIKVLDNQKPILSTPGDIQIASLENNCQSALVEMDKASAVDCNPNVVITNDSPYAFNSGSNASGRYPFGSTVVTFTANDGCGNMSSAKVTITVKDGRKPSPICYSGVVVEMGQGGSVELWASDIEASSSDNCTAQELLKLRIRVGDPDNVSQDPPDTDFVTLSCDVFTNPSSPNVTAIPVEFWVGDGAGNWDYCLTFIAVQDNMDACPDPTSSGSGDVAGMIAGKVEMSDGSPVDGVDLNLESSNSSYNQLLQGINGNYLFSNLGYGMDYSIDPEKESDYLEGVTTYDILKITRHLLGSETFTSPYEMIAADVNGSGSISTSDIVMLRRLILDINQDFGPDQKSWSFIPTDYQFINPTAPLSENFEQPIVINSLNTEVFDANFVGVKIGDINQSISSGLVANSSEKISKSFRIPNASFGTGQEVLLELNGSDLGAIAGMQFELAFDPDILELVDYQIGAYQSISNSNFSFHDNSIKFSWVDIDNKTIDQLLSLRFRAKKTGSFEEGIYMKEDQLNPETYSSRDDIASLKLEFISSEASSLDLTFVPNPFVDKTNVLFNLGESQELNIKVFDVSGKEIRGFRQVFSSGENRIILSRQEFNGPGVYYVRLQNAQTSITKKLVLVH